MHITEFQLLTATAIHSLGARPGARQRLRNLHARQCAGIGSKCNHSEKNPHRRHSQTIRSATHLNRKSTPWYHKPRAIVAFCARGELKGAQLWCPHPGLPSVVHACCMPRHVFANTQSNPLNTPLRAPVWPQTERQPPGAQIRTRHHRWPPPQAVTRKHRSIPQPDGQPTNSCSPCTRRQHTTPSTPSRDSPPPTTL